MNIAAPPKGALFRCPVCGAEVVLLAPCPGCFEPRCCGRAMQQQPRRVVFLYCAVCGSEIAVLRERPADFQPRCCSRPMRERVLDNTA